MLVGSIAVQVLRILQTYCLGRALSMDASVAVYFALVPLILLIVLLPVSINGIGTTHVAFVWFFARAGTTNRQHVPAVALVAQGAWSCLLALPGGNLYNQLLEYIIPADVVFYTLMVGAVIAMRIKSPAAVRPYRTFAYPLPALIYIVLATLVVADFIYMAPGTSGIGALIVLTGIPVYLVWSRFARPVKESV